MKRFFLTIAVALAFCVAGAQKIFTVVYATSSDDFVNVRAEPSGKARILTRLYSAHHGHGDGILVAQKGNWTKVTVGGITGWAYSKYVGTQTWYTGQGKHWLVAASPMTAIYGEDYADSGQRPVFATVEKGTIIADEFQKDENGYTLITAHDYLFIRKQDARVVEAK